MVSSFFIYEYVQLSCVELAAVVFYKHKHKQENNMQNNSPNQLGQQDEDESVFSPGKEVQTGHHKVRNVVLSIAVFAGSILGTYSILGVVTPKKVAQSSVSTTAETVTAPEKGTIGSVEEAIATDKKTEEQIDDSLVSQDMESVQAEAISTQDLEGDYGDF